MHTASSVKIPCYLLKSLSGNENMGVSRADYSVKFDKLCPLAIPNQISLMSMHIYVWFFCCCFFCCFLFGFYGPFKNISLILSRSFIEGGRKPENPEKNHLTIRKQNLAFPHMTRARLEPHR